MLRGIAGVVAEGQIVSGSFYLQPDHAGANWVFLRVAGSPQNAAPGDARNLIFDRQDRYGMFFEEMGDGCSVAVLPPVGVRIDPTSKMGTAFSSNIRPGMLSIVGQEAFVTVQLGRGPGRLTVNLATGEVVGASPPSGWMSFSKWSLIVDDGEEEITLVSYDTTEMS